VYKVCNFNNVQIELQQLQLGHMFAAERWPAKTSREHGSIPASTLLHARLRSADVAWQPAVPYPVSARADAAAVWRQEHDGGVWPASRTIPDRRDYLPRSDVDARSRRADAERTE